MYIINSGHTLISCSSWLLYTCTRLSLQLFTCISIHRNSRSVRLCWKKLQIKTASDKEKWVVVLCPQLTSSDESDIDDDGTEIIKRHALPWLSLKEELMMPASKTRALKQRHKQSRELRESSLVGKRLAKRSSLLGHSYDHDYNKQCLHYAYRQHLVPIYTCSSHCLIYLDRDYLE